MVGTTGGGLFEGGGVGANEVGGIGEKVAKVGAKVGFFVGLEVLGDADGFDVTGDAVGLVEVGDLVGTLVGDLVGVLEVGVKVVGAAVEGALEMGR